MSFASLRSSKRFTEIYRTGTRSRTGALVVLRAPNDGAPEPRAGFVAGKKVGNAVRRNRAKRRMRAAVRRVDLPTGTDFIFVATPSVPDAPFDDLVRWVAMSTKDPT